MRWLVAIGVSGACGVFACGGKSAPAEETSLTNSVPPPPPSEICEDTVAHYPPTIGPGLVIDEETFLERAIREHEPVLRNCYTQRLKYKPHLAGRVTVELTINGDGKATHIHTKGFDEELDRCLCEKLGELHFETLSGGEVKASYPFYFSPPAM